MGNWQPINQQENKIDLMGIELSKQINCAIRYLDRYNKPIFECKHLVTFPQFAVEPAYDNKKWSHIIQKHEEEKDLIDESRN